MATWEITDLEIEEAEKILLPNGCHFAEDARDVIRCWESTDVSACPGSGKTTVLLAKLKLIADRMPLDNGAGICVLSHTNVAVNEIKSKLSAYADKLLNYPNFIGTIQTFVDHFLTFPYIKTITKVPVFVVDERTYAQHFCSELFCNKKYQKLAYFVRLRHHQSNNQGISIVEYIEKLYVANGALQCKGQKKMLAGEKTNYPQQFLELKYELLKQEGLLTYQEAYQYATQAISDFDCISDLLSRRFRFIFVDEFQDCDEGQRRIIEQAFDTTQCSVMRIGDPDQAIYNSDQEKTEDWVPKVGAMTIESSNRYHQEIANILSPLRTDCAQISSLRGDNGLKPTIILYNNDCKQRVIWKFIGLLEEYGITDPDGVYKAIGWVKSETSKGLKIGDYWDGYNTDTGNPSEMKYWSLIEAICDDLKKHKIYRAENSLRKLLIRVLTYLGYKNDNGGPYTYSSIKKAFDKGYLNGEIYRSAILNLVALPQYSREMIDSVVRNTVHAMLENSKQSADIFQNLPKHFMEDVAEAKTKSESNNIICDPIRGRKISVSTIHKVKGETHDATLYLETVYNRKSDIERVIPYYNATTPGKAKIDNYSRKCVYVGFSRPRKLLCVAMREETYISAGDAFSGWNVVYC